MKDPLLKLKPHIRDAYALLRMVAGFMFAFHGVQKIFGVLAEQPIQPFTQLWVGGLIELSCGLAVMVGLKTRWLKCQT